MIAISYSEYGGVDWHGCEETTTFLKNNDTYDFTGQDLKSVIAEFIYDMIQNMYVDTIEKGKTTRTVKLTNVPTIEEIKNKISKKESIDATSEPDKISTELDAYPEIEFHYDPEKYHIEFSYGFGQINYSGWIQINNIEDQDVRYIVCENFLCPAKGVPSVQRFYHEPFNTQAEAEKYMDEMTLHKDFNSVKELIIVDVNTLGTDTWYQTNLKVINMLKQTECDKFGLYAFDHLTILEEAAGIYDSMMVSGGNFTSMASSSLELYEYYVMDYQDKNCKGKLFIHATGEISLAREGEPYDYAYGAIIGEALYQRLLPKIEDLTGLNMQEMKESLQKQYEIEYPQFVKDMAE